MCFFLCFKHPMWSCRHVQRVYFIYGVSDELIVRVCAEMASSDAIDEVVCHLSDIIHVSYLA